MPGDPLKKFDRLETLYERNESSNVREIERTPWRRVCRPLIIHGVHGHGLEPYYSM